MLLLAVVAGARAASPDVKITAAGFEPPTVTVTAGQVVTWQNTTSTGREVVADDGSFESGILLENDQFANLFEAPGTYAYHDGTDSTVRGTVIVKAAPPTPTPAGTPPPTPLAGTPPPGFKTPVPVPTDQPVAAATASAGASAQPPTAGASPPPAAGPSAGPDPAAALAIGLAAVGGLLALWLWRRRRSRASS